MLTFVTQKDLREASDKYYRRRWDYVSEAIRLCRTIPHVEEFTTSDVLEIGPYKLPLVPGCDVMDFRRHGPEVTYFQDASCPPWQVADGRYRLLIALQVWEHLKGRQLEAFQEVRRVAGWAVLSVPHMWPESTFRADHANITLETMAEWTGMHPVAATVVPKPAPPVGRLVCLYDTKSDHLISRGSTP